MTTATRFFVAVLMAVAAVSYLLAVTALRATRGHVRPLNSGR